MRRNSLSLVVSLCCYGTMAMANVEQFVESFDGRGRFESSDGRLVGLDNPGWSLTRDAPARFEGEGLALGPFPTNLQLENESAQLWRDVSGQGGFSQVVKVSGLELASSDQGIAGIRIGHYFDESQNGWALMLIHNPRDSRPDDLVVLMRVNPSDTFEEVFVPLTDSLEFGLTYDPGAGEIAFVFDGNTLDDEGAEVLTRIPYTGDVSDTQLTSFLLSETFGAAKVTIDEWSLLREAGIPIGDFDKNGILDIGDIELLTTAFGSANEEFDLNQDESVDVFDRNIWVHDLAKTWFGDSTLDGEFNSNDLVAVFQAGHYEDGIEGNSTWASGDWNGDAEFNSRDLVNAFADGGYEVGPRVATQSVPEPSALLLASMAGLLFACRSRSV